MPKKKPNSILKYEPDLYMRVVDMSAEAAKKFVGTDVEPVDLGPADEKRWKKGARVWGFPSRPETAREKAHRIWTVAQGLEFNEYRDDLQGTEI